MRAFFAGEIAAEIEDGIADELTRTVVGYVSAAVDFVELHTSPG
jgi:hypothetical protein